MAWQDDDDKRKQQDPWTGNDNKNNNDAPPDLEQAIRRLFKNLKKPNPNSNDDGFFGGNGAGGSSSTGGDNEGSVGAFVGLVGVMLLILWFISGIFIVGPAQKAVVLRFGAYHKTVDPGPHWIPRFIDERYILSVEDISDLKYNAEMLTRDENIVSVGLAVQYRIGNAENYLFKVVNPKESLTQITTSVLRQVIGNKKLDEVLTYGQERSNEYVASKMGLEIKQAISALLDNYQTGLLVTDVAIQFIKPPKAVIEAFDDVIIASEDRARYRSEAEADAQKVTLEAQGIAQRIIEESRAVAQSHIAKSQTKTAQFLGELPQYKMTPNITRERLYLDTMSSILGNNPKLFITAKNSNNLLYMPLDKLLNADKASVTSSEAKEPQHIPFSGAAASSQARMSPRELGRSGRQFRDER